MTITEAGNQFGISPDTIRYYERIGLIPPIHRNKSGIRDFSGEDLRWIEFIKCMRSAGLPIEVLIEYVSLFRQGEETKEARLALLVEQREQLVNRIQEMQETLARLDRKIAYYDSTIAKAEKELR